MSKSGKEGGGGAQLLKGTFQNIEGFWRQGGEDRLVMLMTELGCALLLGNLMQNGAIKH